MTLEKRIAQLEKEKEDLTEKVFRLEEGYLVARIERDDYSDMFYDTLKKLNRMENLSNCPDHELLGMHTRIEAEMYRRKLVKNTNLGGNVTIGIKRVLYPCTCPDCLQGEQLEDHDLYVTYEDGNIINMEGRKIK